MKNNKVLINSNHELEIYYKNKQYNIKNSFYEPYIYECQISCGILELEGINNLIEDISNFVIKHKLPSYYIKLIFNKQLKLTMLLDQIEDNLELHAPNDFSMLLISTNLTNNFYRKELEKCLGEICSVKTRSRKNPNSKNYIRAWFIPKHVIMNL